MKPEEAIKQLKQINLAKAVLPIAEYERLVKCEEELQIVKQENQYNLGKYSECNFQRIAEMSKVANLIRYIMDTQGLSWSRCYDIANGNYELSEGDEDEGDEEEE